MTPWLWIPAALAAWTAASFATAPLIGRALHRAAHRNDVADPADCPPWCCRERAAALLRNQRGGL